MERGKASGGVGVYVDCHKGRCKTKNLSIDMRSVLIVLMWTRNVYYILEQPENSRFLKTPNMQHAVEITGGYLSPLTYQKAFGHDMPKPTRFTTNWPHAVLNTLIRKQPLELTRRLHDPANCDNYRIAINNNNNNPKKKTPQGEQWLDCGWEEAQLIRALPHRALQSHCQGSERCC